VAYVRYASVYRHFQDVEAFREEWTASASAAASFRVKSAVAAARRRLPKKPGKVRK
jgi:hypothetical protein